MGVSTLYVNNPGLQKLRFFTVHSNSLYLYIYRVLKHFVTEPKMMSDLKAANERAAPRLVTNERPRCQYSRVSGAEGRLPDGDVVVVVVG